MIDFDQLDKLIHEKSRLSIMTLLATRDEWAFQDLKAELGLSESELVVTRQGLDDLRDRLYVLEAAVEDVERDLAEADGEQDVRAALTWLLAAARSIVGVPGVT